MTPCSQGREQLGHAEEAMDWDDVRPVAQKSVAVGENLETLSVAELEHRIAAFTAEIERVSAELAKKRAHESAAAALFKKP
jgi:uncharacterized small protein (DUF1192 family)